MPFRQELGLSLGLSGTTLAIPAALILVRISFRHPKHRSRQKTPRSTSYSGEQGVQCAKSLRPELQLKIKPAWLRGSQKGRNSFHLFAGIYGWTKIKTQPNLANCALPTASQPLNEDPWRPGWALIPVAPGPFHCLLFGSHASSPYQKYNIIFPGHSKTYSSFLEETIGQRSSSKSSL